MSTVLKGMEGVVRGYRPQVDWGGEEGSPTIKVGSHNVKIGTSGWRKRCLFILICSLLLLAIINLVMTFYLLKRIHFHTEGAGDLHIQVRGVRLNGISRLDHALTVSNIRGRPGEDLEIKGYYNFTAAVVDEDGHYRSGAVLDSVSGLIFGAKGFTLKNQKGKLLFEAKENGTRVGPGAKFYTITGEGGADLGASIQTPRILGDEVHEFKLESKTRSVIGRAANLLRIESRAGDVRATSLNDATLKTKAGKFRFESRNVFLPNLISEGFHPWDSINTTDQSPTLKTQIPAPNVPEPTSGGDFLYDRSSKSQTTPEGGKQSLQEEPITVYQVCACPNGKLFLSAANFVCNPDDLTCR